jgi:hypothetical protein
MKQTDSLKQIYGKLKLPLHSYDRKTEPKVTGHLTKMDTIIIIIM